jgi:hypothetical protein
VSRCNRDFRQTSGADKGIGGSFNSATCRYHVIDDYWRSPRDLTHDSAYLDFGAAKTGYGG